MTEQTSTPEHDAPRRPIGYQPRLVPNAAGRALGEALREYAAGEINRDEVVESLAAASNTPRTK